MLLVPTCLNDQTLISGYLDESMFVSFHPVKNELYPFGLAVLVFDPDYPPSHPMFELWVDSGKDMIAPILDHQPLSPGNDLTLTFFFPERWMSPKEQRAFLSRLKSHPDVERVNAVRIVTQCPHIVVNAKAEQIAVYQIRNNEGSVRRVWEN